MSNQNEDERRQFKRIKRNYILRFYDNNNPHLRFEITQLVNISRGGTCFISTMPFHLDADLTIELKTPFIADVTVFQGEVLESREKVSNTIYEIRLKFINLTPQAMSVLEKIEQFESEKQ